MYKHYFILIFVFATNIAVLPAQTPPRFTILITELFPDPTPSIELPASEFIELKNTSSNTISLRNWKISDGTTTGVIANNFLLQPDSFVIICASATANLFVPFGTTIGISGFPSLNNEADIITLYSPEGYIIHSVNYTNNWYQNDLKAAGGWTLEMIDTKNPCGANTNWKASINDKGGTPGNKNSIDGINKDEQPPALIRSYTIDSITIVAIFNEAIDSTSGAAISNYQLNNPDYKIQYAKPIAPLFTEVQLRLTVAMKVFTEYSLTVKNITDCTGNSIGIFNATKTGLPVAADSMDIVLNELLFNPPPDGNDYIEFYNRSKSIIDCKQLYIGTKSSIGNISNSKQLTTTSFLIFPGEYLLVTENKKWLQQYYNVKAPMQIIEMDALPPLPDDQGNISLLNFRGEIIDALFYNHQWHFALITNKEGVALERINYQQPTQLKTNWTSAASTSGFGTPTFQNSQFGIEERITSQVNISPKIFSPDNDGVDDFLTIQCQPNEPGYVATIRIFDAAGRKVRLLTANSTLSTTTVFRWDGLNDQLHQLPTGMYIILTEIFNLSGKTKQFKNVVTLAKRF